MKNLYALLNNNGYAQQPMKTFLLDGEPQDMNWQKGLNSYGRRDHLRIWQWTPEGATEPVWVSTSTHDTGAVLSVKYKGFVHHISPDIDDERAKVIRDLNFSGCVKSVSYVSRPGIPTVTQNATGDLVRTDGSVAVVQLQDCQPIMPGLAASPSTSKIQAGKSRLPLHPAADSDFPQRHLASQHDLRRVRSGTDGGCGVASSAGSSGERRCQADHSVAFWNWCPPASN